MTPLHWATIRGYQNSVKELVAAGADLSITSHLDEELVAKDPIDPNSAPIAADPNSVLIPTKDGLLMNAAKAPMGKTAREMVEWAFQERGLVWFDGIVQQQGKVSKAYRTKQGFAVGDRRYIMSHSTPIEDFSDCVSRGARPIHVLCTRRDALHTVDIRHSDRIAAECYHSLPAFPLLCGERSDNADKKCIHYEVLVSAVGFVCFIVSHCLLSILTSSPALSIPPTSLLRAVSFRRVSSSPWPCTFRASSPVCQRGVFTTMSPSRRYHGSAISSFFNHLSNRCRGLEFVPMYHKRPRLYRTVGVEGRGAKSGVETCRRGSTG